MITETVADVLARARQYSDSETTTQAADFVTDAEMTVWLNASYRRLIDLIIANDGQDLLSPVTATLTAPSYALPADFYHPLSLEKPVGNKWRALPMYNFHERNRAFPPAFPGWRIMGQALRLQPTPVGSALGSLQLWYLPNASALTTGSFQVFGGWDDYLSYDIAIQILNKEERDTRALDRERDRAERRIKEACASHLAATPDKIADLAVYPADFEDFDYYPGAYDE